MKITPSERYEKFKTRQALAQESGSRGRLIAVEYKEVMEVWDHQGEGVDIQAYNPDDENGGPTFGSIYLKVEEDDEGVYSRWIADCPTVMIAEVLARALAKDLLVPLWRNTNE